MIFLITIVRSINFGRVELQTIINYISFVYTSFTVFLLSKINYSTFRKLIGYLKISLSNISSFGVLYRKGLFNSSEIDLKFTKESKYNALKNFWDVDYLLYFMHCAIFLCLKDLLYLSKWINKEHGDCYIFNIYLSIYVILVTSSAIGSLVGGVNNMHALTCLTKQEKYEKDMKIYYMIQINNNI